MSTRGGTQNSLGQKLLLPHSHLVSKERKKTTRKKWEKGHQKPHVARDNYNSKLEESQVCVPTDTGDRVSCESQLTCPAIISYIRTPSAHQSTEKP